jgi:hypothetical protein
MVIDGLNKILLLLFILSSLNVVRHTFFVIRFYMDKKRFSLGRTSLILLGLSISYIIVGIIEGIKI